MSPRVDIPIQVTVPLTSEECYAQLLSGVEPMPPREGIKDTPRRAAAAFHELTRGYWEDPAELFTTFEADEYDQLVLQRGVAFYSLCEHHLLPFHGRAHVGYLPGERIVGLSKLARLVGLYSRRLQVQERLTDQIAAALDRYLEPRGVIVVIEAAHLCMEMRGVQARGASTTTSSLRGVFLHKPEARAEALALIRGS